SRNFNPRRVVPPRLERYSRGRWTQQSIDRVRPAQSTKRGELLVYLANRLLPPAFVFLPPRVCNEWVQIQVGHSPNSLVSMHAPEHVHGDQAPPKIIEVRGHVLTDRGAEELILEVLLEVIKVDGFSRYLFVLPYRFISARRARRQTSASGQEGARF